MVIHPKSLNNLYLGISIGLMLPFVFFFLYFLFRFHGTHFTVYLNFLIESGKLVHVMSLSVIPNLAPFFFFVNSDRYRSGRGILGATVFLGILIFVIKLL